MAKKTTTKKTSKKATKKTTAKKVIKKVTKKVKKVVKKKAVKKTAKKAHVINKLDRSAKVTVKAKKSPFREGSGRDLSFRAMKTGMTVEKALEKVKLDRLKFMVKMKLISIK